MESKETVRIGGRRSKLAVVQSEQVKVMIESKFSHIECPLLSVHTLGDQVQSKPLYSFGGKAVWTKELEDLLYKDDESRIDLIVHSLKDMPTLLPDGFELGGITKRVDPTDALVMPIGSPYSSLSELPDGSVVGTSSVRRSAQLKRKFPNLKFESIRGNIQTRLAKLDDPETPYKCIVLASAGLMRSGLDSRITQRFNADTMCYAVGQGALGIEIRKDDEKMKKILKEICDPSTTICCLAERSLLRTLEGGCSVPIGVVSNYDESTKVLTLKGIVINVEGTEWVEIEHKVTISNEREDSINCGKELAAKLTQNGAKEILDSINLDKIT
ncbi:hydroxymethylbilane synthase [Kluyveromyces lactis]|uniref:Porphobilinogen deaminase n=1 Tax=Kluyveromyces lactis (strain ATCC 8585 / CBS 2359 / DSM 70799 / NBRC 1267 / NRRL Y-1140 / WM37) TaxID=284590 RepID=HEM3_KLULA|nr:uncharacterized protein KLLA0_C15147g [Kluyveromyces lactis]Q6CT60.1 RecName: Full=Porphobilinogen deaminase; Short=PBG; AltName: Full=Hydroxymethylbilane synthase; Short=HMBS; AltName: Full=Pre-uroporphyrinogen synthase [Kluyveromyces lactis NRRL Y-1140]CAH01730.1 KLLA0C15147p [Kluyveromyces lactis]|eukprot:XP_452879.1 uncharacterized protein KLLA0_C15147g [Kluyveromyces lactis]